MAGNRLGPNDWTPSYPDAAVSPERGVYDKPGEGGVPWEKSPPTSHVYGWKLLTGGFVEKFYGPAIGAPAGTVSVLTVGFKPPPVNKVHPDEIETTYEYFFTDAALAEKYLGDFRANPNPGKVVQLLIAAGVPYRKMSG